MRSKPEFRGVVIKEWSKMSNFVCVGGGESKIWYFPYNFLSAHSQTQMFHSAMQYGRRISIHRMVIFKIYDYAIMVSWLFFLEIAFWFERENICKHVKFNKALIDLKRKKCYQITKETNKIKKTLQFEFLDLHICL